MKNIQLRLRAVFSVMGMVGTLVLSGCGGGGETTDGTTSLSAPPAKERPMSLASNSWDGYDLEARIAAIRQHPSYGSTFTDTSNTHAPNGLSLPTAPQVSCMTNQVTVTSLSQFNTEAAGSCKRIILTPSATPYSGYAHITGEDIEAVFTGTTITPTDGNDVGSSRVDLQACKLEYSIVSPK